MSEPVIRAVGLHKRFAGATGEVLGGVDLTIAVGERVAILGPSGSGKSTLLHLLGGLDRPTRGTVVVDGQELGALDDGALAALRRDRLGFVFQDHHLLPQCTALENVLLPTLATGLGRPTATATERATALLDRLGLADRRDHLPSALSTGQRQRVAVARALIRDPKVVLADEPTGALDPVTAGELVDLLLELDRSVALVVVTHAAHVAEAMDRVLVLGRGQIDEAPR